MSTKEDSDSEEEIIVYAEFQDSVNITNYRSIHVLGINESNPIIQTDDTFFTGKYESSLGTYMFFEEDTAAKSKDPLFDRLPEKNVKYLTKTRKLLRMEDAYVTPKAGEGAGTESQSQIDDSIKPVRINSIAEGIEMFRKRRLEELANENVTVTEDEEKVIEGETEQQEEDMDVD